MIKSKPKIFNFQLSIIVIALVLASCSSKKSEGPAPTITLKGVTLVYIPAGSFTMGSSTFTDPDRFSDEVQHPVTLTEGFYLSECAITNAQYCVFLNEKSIGTDGKLGSSTYSLIKPHEWGCTYTGGQWQPVSGYGIHPVIMVSWYGADEYCKWANAAKGHLPTEAEWEYACRAGTTGPFNTGADLTTDQANYDGRYPYNKPYIATGTNLGHTEPVKSYAAVKNAFGLYNMHGNIWEWCSDWYVSNLGTAPVDNPQGPSESTPEGRVFRGGGWDGTAKACRSAFRNASRPDDCDSGFGFRLACSL